MKKSTIKIFKSLEIDIRPDGTLAVPDDGVDKLDFAIASIHSTFKQPRQITTDRILKALTHPKVKILGHPTGRLIGKREPIDADWLTIFNFCIKHHKALEINASPDRLDVPWLLVKKAAAQGALFAINTDAHHASQLNGIQSGIDVARRGWLSKDQVVNTWTLKKFTDWLRA